MIDDILVFLLSKFGLFLLRIFRVSYIFDTDIVMLTKVKDDCLILKTSVSTIYKMRLIQYVYYNYFCFKEVG
jgi:hypothetical protein